MGTPSCAVEVSDGHKLVVNLRGDWTFDNATAIERSLQTLPAPKSPRIEFHSNLVLAMIEKSERFRDRWYLKEAGVRDRDDLGIKRVHVCDGYPPQARPRLASGAGSTSRTSSGQVRSTQQHAPSGFR